jgi:hypothetical protein
MENKPLNRSLHAAKATKQDEFYTQLSDIEKELRHYTKHFTNKIILCNCDDPKVSNFFHYFSHNFEKLKLKKLITICYKNCDADLFSKHTGEKGIYPIQFGSVIAHVSVEFGWAMADRSKDGLSTLLAG